MSSSVVYQSQLRNHINKAHLYQNSKLLKQGQFKVFSQNKLHYELVIAKFYFDRVECYNAKKQLMNFIKTKKCYLFLSSNKSINNVNLESENKQSNELFLLHNSYTQQAFHFLNQEQQENWIDFLKSLFIQSNKLIPNFYNTIEKIGQGSYAKVYLAQEYQTKKYYCIKQFQKDELKKDEFSKQFFNELTALRFLLQKQMIDLKETIEGKSYIYIVMEYFEYGTLDEFLHQKQYLHEQDALYIIKALLYQLQELHSNSIIHGDVKLQNIALKKQNGKIQPVLIDFGFSQIIYNDNQKKNELYEWIGTPGFCPPELFKEIEQKKCYKISPKFDIFSLGIVFYNIVTGVFPFCQRNRFTLIDSNQKCDISFNKKSFLNKYVSSKTIYLLVGMLCTNPNYRYSIEQMLKQKDVAKIQIEQSSCFDSLNRLTNKKPFSRVIKEDQLHYNFQYKYINSLKKDSSFSPTNFLYMEKYISAQEIQEQLKNK